MDEVSHLTREQLEAGLAPILDSPRDKGSLELLVRRPSENEREVVPSAQLDLQDGMVGDRWSLRPGGGNPETQITLMNARAVALIAQTKERWPLAGDQFYVDLDLSDENLPPGSRLEVGSAVLEVTAEPHTGCSKFVSRFGVDAMKFVNSERGRALNLRGINAKVVQPGSVEAGATIRKAGS